MDFVVKVRVLYPDPKGALRKALNVNLDNFFIPVGSIDVNCTHMESST
jgi:hypothetical protein